MLSARSNRSWLLECPGRSPSERGRRDPSGHAGNRSDGCVRPRAWRYDLSAPPRTRNLVDDFRHSSHYLSGLIHCSSDLIHHLSGLIHRLSGLIHRLSDLIHHLSGLIQRSSSLIHRFSSLTHHFSGLFQDFHGEVCFSRSAVAASPCTTFCQGRHPGLVFVKTCSHAGRIIPAQPVMQRGPDVYRFGPL